MSTDLYAIGLWWDGRRGVAKHDGVEVRLVRGPVLGRLAPDRMEFNPALQVAWVADRACDSRRDMSPDETEDASLWLVRMSSAVRQVVG